MEALRTADEIRDVNTRYHDVAASSYDSKWGIDFGQVGQAPVVGKPSRFGDRLASVPKRGAMALAPAWRCALRAAPARRPDPGASVNGEDHGLEQVVDIRAFAPEDLARHARAAGFVDTRVRGEE